MPGVTILAGSLADKTANCLTSGMARGLGGRIKGGCKCNKRKSACRRCRLFGCARTFSSHCTLAPLCCRRFVYWTSPPFLQAFRYVYFLYFYRILFRLKTDENIYMCVCSLQFVENLLHSANKARQLLRPHADNGRKNKFLN